VWSEEGEMSDKLFFKTVFSLLTPHSSLLERLSFFLNHSQKKYARRTAIAVSSNP
jgi:hypothetical protein